MLYISKNINLPLCFCTGTYNYFFSKSLPTSLGLVPAEPPTIWDSSCILKLVPSDIVSKGIPSLCNLFAVLILAFHFFRH